MHSAATQLLCLHPSAAPSIYIIYWFSCSCFLHESLPAAFLDVQMTLVMTDCFSFPVHGWVCTAGADFSLMLPRCCFVWSVLKEFWLCPFPCFPTELSHLFFPGSSCHLHQKVNLFLFPISAFITWKWLLWKILIKHRLFPGWTETALQLLNRLTSCFVCRQLWKSVCA